MSEIALQSHSSTNNSRLIWNNDALTCRVDVSAHSPRSGATLRNTVRYLEDAGCTDTPDFVETPHGTDLRWTRVGKVTYSWEWPVEAWRSAALLCFRSLAALRTHGLAPAGIQPTDVFMAGGRPIMVNLASIAPWSPARDRDNVERVNRYFVRPFMCGVMGRADVARRLMRGGRPGLSLADQTLAIGSDMPAMSGADSNPITLLQELSLPSPTSDGWPAYEGEIAHAFGDEAVSKTAVITHLLERWNPTSALDLGCNQGKYSFLASESGSIVTGVDGNEWCMNSFFARSKASRGIVTAAVVDLIDPPPARGWGAGWAVALSVRLESECVLALGILHHLLLGMHLSHRDVRHLFGSLATRILLVEFAPSIAGDRYSWASSFFSEALIQAILDDLFITEAIWRYGTRGRSLMLMRRRSRPTGS